jgi:hypothetical protein
MVISMPRTKTQKIVSPAPEPVITEGIRALWPEAQRIVKDQQIRAVDVQQGTVHLMNIQGSKEKERSGWFWLPRLGVERGNYYLVYCTEGEHWANIVIIIPTDTRSLSELELVYLRSCFFKPNTPVVQYIRDSEQYSRIIAIPGRVKSTTLWCSIDNMAIPAAHLKS